jgi:hypothetical protein
MTTAAITNAAGGQAMPSRTPQVYNNDQWISYFEDAMVKLRPHITMRILTTIGLIAWNQKGTKGIEPALAALDWWKAMDKSK